MRRYLANGWHMAGTTLVVAAFILAIWQLGVLLLQPPAYLVPSPLAVFGAIADNFTHLVASTQITLGEMLLGLAVGAAAGIVVALIIARFPRLERFMMPAIVTTQTLPVFAIAPLLVIWFGYGIGSKVVMAALIIFFPVASAFHDGLKSTERVWLDLARGWGARPDQSLIKVRLPAALPSLASGLKVAAALAPIGAIVGEWAGASGGLGYVMLQANARVQTDMVFACIIILALTAFALRLAVASLCDRLIFWQGQTH
jgi:putative hydroxymethylpyrimidine transport system permease protein